MMLHLILQNAINSFLHLSREIIIPMLLFLCNISFLKLLIGISLKIGDIKTREKEKPLGRVTDDLDPRFSTFMETFMSSSPSS